MRNLSVSMISKWGYCFSRASLLCVLIVRRIALTRILCQIQKAVYDLSRR
jgi:hypothetical protein